MFLGQALAYNEYSLVNNGIVLTHYPTLTPIQICIKLPRTKKKWSASQTLIDGYPKVNYVL